MAKDKLIKGTTSTGFEYALEIDRLNNYELVEMLVQVQNGDYLKVVEVVNLMLGEDQKKQLIEHIRTEDGFVPADKMTEEITEIYSNVEIKN